MREKWYLQTWFICILFALWVLIVPAVLGVIFLILQIIDDSKLIKKYGRYNDLDATLAAFEEQNSRIQKEISEKKNILADLEKEILDLTNETICNQYDFSTYDNISSEECKNQLAVLKNEEREAIKSQSVIAVSKSISKKASNDNIKQLFRCFNSECDNIIQSLTAKNIDAMRSKISKSFESLNKIFVVDGIQMTSKLLEYKLEELNLVYTYELKKEQEREYQKAIKEQMLEEEKVRREIEREKAKLEKDQTQCSNEISRLMGYMQKTSSDTEKQLYIDKIKELEDRLKSLEKDKESVLEREAHAMAGFVYVISNIGSFGEGVYKIGMTRRLEPMDRINELSSASVPFEFDVHAMIFSDNAPALENALHKHFEKQSVNRVNLRKEFFRVSLAEIESVVKENYSNTVTFTKIPVATEYHQTLEILKTENAVA